MDSRKNLSAMRSYLSFASLIFLCFLATAIHAQDSTAQTEPKIFITPYYEYHQAKMTDLNKNHYYLNLPYNTKSQLGHFDHYNAVGVDAGIQVTRWLEFHMGYSKYTFSESRDSPVSFTDSTGNTLSKDVLRVRLESNSDVFHAGAEIDITRLAGPAVADKPIFKRLHVSITMQVNYACNTMISEMMPDTMVNNPEWTNLRLNNATVDKNKGFQFQGGLNLDWAVIHTSLCTVRPGVRVGYLFDQPRELTNYNDLPLPGKNDQNIKTDFSGTYFGFYVKIGR